MSSPLSIGRRLSLGFGAVLALALVVAIYGSLQFHRLSEQTDLLAHERMVRLDQVSMLRDNVGAASRNLRDLILLTDPVARLVLLQDQRAVAMSSAKTVADLGKALADDPVAGPLMKGLLATRMQFNAAAYKVYQQTQQGGVDVARATLFETMVPAQLSYQRKLDEMTELERRLSSEAADEVQAGSRRAAFVMLMLAALSVALGSWAGWRSARAVTGQLGGEPAYAASVVREIADGNLGVEIATRGDGRHNLLSAMKDMRDRLAAIVSQVRQSSDGIATGASEIATGNQDLSQRTEHQASNLQQTAASLEQLAGTVRQNADTAHEASRMAGSASAAAVEGGRLVSGVVRTMGAISDSSRRIADIIGTVDAIAFQTNILALNAAVEAARAGEQGRGFAVVAGEVGALARRSAEAAKEIKTLIEGSVESVESGSRQAGEAGAAMNELVARVRGVSELIAGISTATQEQTDGIGQVSGTMSQLDQATQQNAALVEEAAAAAASLRQQTQQLVKAVAGFRL